MAKRSATARQRRRLHTISELGERLGLTSGHMTELLRKGRIDPPNIRYGNRSYYDAEALEQAAEKYRSLRDGHLSLTQLAELLGVQRPAIESGIRTGRLPQPARKIGRKWCYSLEQAAEITRTWQGGETHSCPRDGHLSQKALAELLGVRHRTVAKWVRQGRLPQPAHKTGQQWYYSPEQVAEIRRTWDTDETHRALRNSHISQKALARLLGVQSSTITYRVRTGKLPQPAHRTDRQCFFSPEQVAEIRRTWSTDLTPRTPRNGHISRNALADLLGVQSSTIAHNTRTGRLPQPAHKTGRQWYYSPEQVAEIRRTWKPAETRRSLPDHHLSQKALARLLGVQSPTIIAWVRTGRLPQPARKTGRQWYYSPEQVADIKRSWKPAETHGSLSSGCLSRQALADLLGVHSTTITFRIRTGRLPKPAQKIGRQWYYSPEQVADIKRRSEIDEEHRSLQNGHLNQSALAKLLGVRHTTVAYRVRTGRLPQPAQKIDGQWFFSPAQVTDILRRSAADEKRRSLRSSCLSRKALAELLGVHTMTIALRVRRGRLPQPAHKTGRQWYYSPEQVAEIQRTWESPETHSSLWSGYLSRNALADPLGVHTTAIAYRTRMGRLPQPAHKTGRKWYYSPEQVSEIKRAYGLE